MRASWILSRTAFLALALSLGAGCTQAPSKKRKVSDGETADAKADGDQAQGKKQGKGDKNQPPLGPIPDGPIAKVGDKEIGRDTFNAIYDLKLQKYKDRKRKIPRSADRRYRRSITERLIYQELLRQEAAKLGVEYDQEKLEQRQAQQKKGIRNWEEHLRRRGESEGSLREMYIAELRERAILEKTGVLEVSDDEIDAEYEKVKPNYKKDKERVRASHILVSVGPKERPKPGEKRPEPTEEQKKAWEEEARKKADEILEKAKAEGADFAALAREYSDGPSARKGGDLGIFTAERMVKEFSDAAFALDVGGISEPIKTRFGFHVIKVFGKYPPGDLPKEAIADQIKARLANQKLHQGRRELKERLYTDYAVVNHMEKHLGPDPRKKKGPAMRGHGGHGHGPKGPRGPKGPKGPKGSKEKGPVAPGQGNEGVKGAGGAKAGTDPNAGAGAKPAKGGAAGPAEGADGK